jgi:rod shape-determining protein MreC
LRTIAIGSGTINRLELPYIPNNADIRPGDLLITSGLGGHFPPGYPVAEVSAVQHDPGHTFSTVTATPLADLDRSREVLLVWPGEITLLEPADKNAAAPAETATSPEATATPEATTATPEATATPETTTATPEATTATPEATAPALLDEGDTE